MNNLQRKVLKNEDEEKYEKTIDPIEKSLLAISKNAITLSRFSNLENLDKKEQDLKELIRKIKRSYMLPSSKLRLNINTKEKIQVKIDTELFTTAIKNLVNNALEEVEKFDDNDNNNDSIVNINLSTEKKFCILKITNQCKVDEKEKEENKINIDKIFQLGYTTKETGSGVGVSISQQIIEKMDGEMKMSYSEETKIMTVEIRVKV